MKRRELSLEERKIVISNFKDGKSLSEIGKIVGRSKSTIQNVVNRYNCEKRIDNLQRPGRPKLLSDRDERFIKAIVKKNTFESTPKIALSLEIAKKYMSIIKYSAQSNPS